MEVERTRMLAVPHYYVVAAPEGAKEQLPALIALHGYAGDMTSMLRIAREIAGNEMLVACPQAPHQFRIAEADGVDGPRVGFGWLTQYRAQDSHARHHLLMRGVIEDLLLNFRAAERSIFLLGFSQACALNYRLVFAQPGLFRGVIGVCGGIPGDFQDPKYQSTRASVLHVAATRDAYYDIERVRLFESALRRLAADVTYREYDSPHIFPPPAIPYIRDWIIQKSRSDHASPGIKE